MKLNQQRLIGLFIILLQTNLLTAQLSNDGLLAYYPFDGNVLDLGPSNFDGTLQGGIYSNDESGNPNSALELDGINDYVDLSTFATTYRDNTGELSVYFKIKFNEEGNNQTILSLGSSGETAATNVFEIEYENNQLQVETEVFSTTANNELQIDGQDTLFDGQWHELLFTFEGTALKYYRDNVLIFDGTYVPAETNSTNLFLGCFSGSNSSSCCFTGAEIDELQFYSRILTIDDILSVKEFSKNSVVKFYPNPVIDILEVELNKQFQHLNITLKNILGQTVKEFKIDNSKSFSVELNLESGLYLLDIKDLISNETVKTIKFIKK